MAEKKDRRIFKTPPKEGPFEPLLTLEIVLKAKGGDDINLCDDEGNTIGAGRDAEGDPIGSACVLIAGVPGSALDAWLAHRVLGWGIKEREIYVGGAATDSFEILCAIPGRGERPCPEFTTSDAGMGRFLDEVKSKDEMALKHLHLWYHEKTWRCRWWAEDRVCISAYTRAHAVAKAALVKALALYSSLAMAPVPEAPPKPVRVRKSRLPSMIQAVSALEEPEESEEVEVAEAQNEGVAEEVAQ